MYKKYIIRRGKKIGPYYYKSIRLRDGRIKSVYIGKEVINDTPAIQISEPHKDHHYLYIAAIILFLAFFITELNTDNIKMNFNLPSGNLLTGFATLDAGQQLVGPQEVNIIESRLKQGIYVNKDSSFILSIEPQMNLNSVKVTGSINYQEKENFLVKISLNNNIIYEKEVTENQVDNSSQKTKNKTKKFEFLEQCIETCNLNLSNKDYTININVSNALLFIDEFVISIISNTTNQTPSISIYDTNKEINQTSINETTSNLTFEEINFTPQNVTFEIINTEKPEKLSKRLHSPKAEKGPNWVKECNNGVCTMDIYPYQINILDADNNYKPFDEVVDILKINDNKVKISFLGKEVNLSISNVSLIGTKVTKDDANIDWAPYFNLTSFNTAPNIELESERNIVIDNQVMRIDEIEIDLGDLVGNNFDIQHEKISNKKTKIRLNKDYKNEGSKIGDKIDLDPTIKINGNGTNITEDAYITFREDLNTYTRTTTEVTMRAGIRRCATQKVYERRYIDWNVSLIPDNSVIAEVNLTIRVTVVDDITDLNLTQMNIPGRLENASDAFTDAGSPIYSSLGNIAADVTYEVTLGNTAAADLQKNLTGSDEFSVGIRNSETGAVPDCPTTDLVVTRIATEESANIPVLTVTYRESGPVITLNSPTNYSNFTEIGSIILNATIVDDNNATIKEVVFFGMNNTDPDTFDILFINRSVLNNSVVTYNWSNPVIKNSGNTVLLMHFDNRSEYHENSTYVRDFSGLGNNGTVTGATWNWTDGKFGGAFYFDGVNDNINLGDQDELIDSTNGITYMFWVKPLDITTNDALLVKIETTGQNNGLGIQKRASNITLFINSITVRRIDVTGVLKLNEYRHIAITITSGGLATLYLDGIKNDTASGTLPLTNNINFVIGELGANDYNGFIDELVIYNRTLGDAEIMDHYRLRSGNFQWRVNATDGNFTNSSTLSTLRVDRSPNITSIKIEPSTANTTDQLNCTFSTYDDLSTTLNAFVEFFKNNITNTTVTGSFANGTNSSLQLTRGIQNKPETWDCRVKVGDTLSNSTHTNSTNSSIVNVTNSRPSIPVLYNPLTNATIFDPIPAINWTAAIDEDNDTVNYLLVLKCFNKDTLAACPTSDNRNISWISGNGTAINTSLLYYGDDSFVYNWTIIANDSQNGSSSPLERNFSLGVLVAITLPTSNINFGDISPDQNADTSDGTPAPFQIQNDGNARFNVNMTVNSLIFTSQPDSSLYFQYKARNTTEAGSIINNTVTQVAYANVAAPTRMVVIGLNYTNSTDLAEMDLNITVPSEETPGAKSSIITLTATYPGYGGFGT